MSALRLRHWWWCDLKSPRCFKKQDIGKTKKMGLRFKVLDLWALGALPRGGQDIEDSLGEPRAQLRPQPQKGSNKKFTKKIYIKIPDLVLRPTAAPSVAGRNRR